MEAEAQPIDENVGMPPAEPFGDTTVVVAKPAPKRPAMIPPPRPQTPANEDEQNVRDWLESLAGDTDLKVVIRRRKPMLGPNGEKIDGVLETVDEKIDEEYLRETWGGGIFSLQVMTMQRNGKYSLLRARSVNVAGPPKMHGQLLVAGVTGASVSASSDDDSLQEMAFRSMTELAKEERARADRISREAASAKPSGFDLQAMQQIQAPLVAQIGSYQKTISDLQHQVLTLSTREAPRDDFRDKLLERAVNDESTRVAQLREGFEQRVEGMRENHEAAIKRLEERHGDAIVRLEKRHEDEVARMEKAHEREILALDRQYGLSTKSLDTANLTRVDSLKDEKSRLERELAAAQVRIATLEAKKDQSLTEKADELIKVKEALEGLGGGNDEPEEKWYEKLLDLAGNSEAALKLIDKIGGGPSGDPQQQMAGPQMPPPGVPWQGPDGQWYVADQNGRIGMVDPRYIAQLQQQRQMQQIQAQQPQQPGKPGKRAHAAAAATQQPQQPAPPPPGKMPAAKDIKRAVDFMENAVKNNTSPAAFASAARNLVGADVLKFIQRVGIDKLLDTVVEPGSPLTTVRGRQFARQVAATLVGGSEVAAAPAAAAPVPAPVAANDEAPDDGEDDDDEDDELDDAISDLGGEE